MEVAEKEDGDSFMGEDSSSFMKNYSSIDNCIELTANTEKLNFNVELNLNVENSYKDHTTFNKSALPCNERNYSGFNHYSGFSQDSRFNHYSEFNLITQLTVSKVTHDSDKQNIASSVIGYRTRGVMGWQQKI